MTLEAPALTYPYVESPDGAFCQKSQRLHPLTISRKGDTWERFNERLAKEKIYEDGYNLMAGCINLINHIEDAANSDTPIETLLFLDRSGRLAAYILRITYEQIAETYDEEGRTIASHMPKIRFINVGSEDWAKHSDRVAHARLSHMYHPVDLAEGSVLIVDEYILSGASVRNTGRVLRDCGFADEAPAISMFRQCPEWYGDNKVKGVAEVGFINIYTRSAIEELANRLPEHIDRATEIIRHYGWRNVLDRIKIGLITNPAIPEEDVTFVEHLVVGNPIEQVVQYLASNGGLLSLSPTPEMISKGHLYREKLHDLVKMAFDQKLVTCVRP